MTTVDASRLMTRPGVLDVLLVNSAPVLSFGSVFRRFDALLKNAACGCEVRLHVARFESLPPVRFDGKMVQSARRLLDSRHFDAAVVTGAEPTCPDLRHEPFWNELTEFHDVGCSDGLPMLLSCLAAHASVLHADGITRSSLPAKCFGVFEVQAVTDDPLLRDVPERFVVPHSRWNGLPEQALSRAGYKILTRSEEVGVDLFTRQGRALNVYLQGHPEYGPSTLLNEYKRDIGRFLRQEGRRPVLPAGTGHERWSSVATTIFANWLDQIQQHGRVPDLVRMIA